MWEVVKKTDRRAIALADRHYSRQKPGSRELGPPGQKIILLSNDQLAVWGSHRPAPWTGIKRMDGFEGHCCFLFRNEGAGLSSQLIREAVALTAKQWGIAPFITYVAVSKIASPNPGYCFKQAGFVHVKFRDKTKHGRMARLENGCGNRSWLLSVNLPIHNLTKNVKLLPVKTTIVTWFIYRVIGGSIWRFY